VERLSSKESRKRWILKEQMGGELRGECLSSQQIASYVFKNLTSSFSIFRPSAD